MFEVKGVQFKKGTPFCYTFDSLGSVLVSGASGKGKTTILEAISFALYDSKSSVYPRSSKGSRNPPSTSVTLTIHDMVIMRQKRPTLLRLTEGGKTYEDDIAEEIIKSRFGESELWFTGGYVKQGQLAGLFGLPTARKLKLFHSMSSFDSERHEAMMSNVCSMISDISEKITNEERAQIRDSAVRSERSKLTPDEVKLAIASGSVNLEIFTEKISAHILNHDGADLESRERELASNIRSIRLDLERYEHHKEDVSILEDQRAMIVFDPAGEGVARDAHEAVAQELKQTKDDVMRKIWENKIKEAREELETIGPVQKPVQTRVKIEVWADIRQRNCRHQLVNCIKDHENALKHSFVYEYTKKLGELRTEIKNNTWRLSHITVARTVHEIDGAISKVTAQIDLANTVLVCPECDTALFLVDDKELTKSSCKTDISALEAKIDRYTKMRQLALDVERLKKNSEECERKIVELGVCPEEPGEFPDHYILNGRTRLTKSISELKAILTHVDTVPIEHTQETLALLLDDHKKRERIDILEPLIEAAQNKIEGLPVSESVRSVPELTDLLKYHSRTIEGLVQVSEKVQGLNRSIDRARALMDGLVHGDIGRYQTTLSELETEQTEVETLIKERGEMEADFSDLQESLQHLRSVSTLDDIVEARVVCLEALAVDRGTHNKVKKSLSSAEYIMIDKTLTQINQLVQEIVVKLFDEPITVTIGSIKELKGSGKIKPEINLKIVYDGAEMASVGEMSGGEASRVSLAIAIAFSKHTKVPFLMLDESMSTLDCTKKESVIEIIEEHVADKLTIFVNHDTTTGVYDSVIEL